MARYNPHARRRSRQFALQAVYQWQMANTSFTDLLLQYKREDNYKKCDPDYFEKLLSAVIKGGGEIDKNLTPHVKIPLSEISAIEMAVLRIACAELQFCDDVPKRVIINEALELTKSFGTQEGYRFVNGVLDSVAKTLRKAE